MKNWDILAIFVAVRLASVFLVQTSYVPDEYWQSLEVAHNIVFGYGYLTWEWTLGLRSYVYPLIIALIYKVLQFLQLDTAEALVFTPRILQALLSAYADLCFYRWAGTRKWAVFSIASSWFWFYTCSRTLINTLESALFTIALSHFPWVGKGKGVGNKFIWLVTFICAVRPTAAVLCVPICLFHLLISTEAVYKLIFKRYLPIGAVVFLSSIALDSTVHGKFIVTSYEFLKANVIQNFSEFYGQQPWHWYLSAGFPAILGIHFVPFVLATIIMLKNRASHLNELALLGCIVFTIFTYSLLSHKEFRFILSVLPVALYISSKYLSSWSRKANTLSLWLVAGVMLVGNVVPAWYLSVVHQRGSLDVMVPLREIAASNPRNTSFLFLTPCHSTPLYSHLHVNVTTRFLTCEPNLNNTQGYVDEMAKFYGNPGRWLRTHYPPNGTLPSHIVSFDVLVPAITDILSRFKPAYRIFHTSIPITNKIGRYIIIHERIDFE